MNFDYAETEIRLTVAENRCQKYFSMAFQEGDRFQPTVGMNDRGLFASLQMQFPAQAGESRHTVDELFVHELFGSIRSFGSVEGVLGFIGDRRLVQYRGVTLHALLADGAGGAMIAEAGKEQNQYLPMDGDFIVMTNFKNSDFTDQTHDQVSGAGADRYIAAHEYIGENIDGFGIEQAFETLELTAQEGSYPTLCSMVFVPGEHSVYGVLQRDFNRIWKISILDRTIETYRGFENNKKFRIPAEGVMASDLMEGDFSAYEVYTVPDEIETDSSGQEETAHRPLPVWYWAAGGLGAVIIVLIGLLVRNRRKAS